MRVVAGLSPVLYHITSTYKAARILQSNRFELKPSEGTSIEENIKQGAYYLSTARTLGSAYIRSNAYPNYSLLVLDGVKLARRYAGKPVDYWGESMRNNGANFESEDRVFSLKPLIPDATSYVLQIHTMLPSGLDARAKKVLFRLQIEAKKRKIPTFYYTNKADFLLLDERHSVPLNPRLLDAAPVNEHDSYSSSLSDWLALWEIPVEAYKRLKLLPLKEQKKRGITERFLRLMNMVSYYPQDVSSFLADLHNAKSVGYGNSSKEREALDTLVSVMRKQKLAPKEFYKFLGDKWRGS